MPSPQIHLGTVGAAGLTFLLAFYLNDPERFRWLLPLIGGAVLLVVDDVVYHASGEQISLIVNKLIYE